MRKQNCWEFKGCGRDKANGKEVCPVLTSRRAHGVNGGRNGGRVCWAVTGTYCDDEVQGTYSQKVMTCTSCAFRVKVREEESYRFIPIFF
jgi:hypothetical protein